MTAPVVLAGTIYCYRLYDVGDEIALEEAARLLRSEYRETRLGRKAAGAMDSFAVPLRVDLDSRKVTFGHTGQVLDVEMSIHFFDSGAASMCIEIPMTPGTSLDSLVPFCQELYESAELEALGRTEIGKMLPHFAPAVSGRHDWDGFETFTALSIRKLEGDPPVADVLAWPGLARLLVGDASAGTLAKSYATEVLEYAFSYEENDLVVVDWNSAFILSPSGSPELIDMLEFANSHLLNLRYYDGRFDAQLKEIYADLMANKGHSLSSPYAKRAHHGLRDLMGLSELVERIDNAIKAVGDFYAARVYRGAMRRLRIEAWKESIERKQTLIGEAYEMLKGEAEVRRGLILELTVIALIVIEVIQAFMGGH